ncbi:hypothetical protein [Pseudonocardia oceani]|uniref:hypothetical protein n=1 Tax=Pseudonocardia oceani TaxID=2792013 RepID=UPI001C4A0BB9|nr:hypothetical protein [Pseudonocardia oceani]
MPVAAAIPMSLVVVAVSSAAALVPRAGAGQIRWRIAGIFGLTGPVRPPPGPRSTASSTPAWPSPGSPC